MTSETLAETALRGIHEKLVAERDSGQNPAANDVYDFFDDIPQQNKDLIISILKNGLEALIKQGYVITPPMDLNISSAPEELSEDDKAALLECLSGVSDL